MKPNLNLQKLKIRQKMIVQIYQKSTIIKKQKGEEGKGRQAK